SGAVGRRAAGGARREWRGAVEGISYGIRQRESGISAGANCGGNRHDDDLEGASGGQGDGEYGTDPAGHEQRRDAAGAGGNRTRGIADPAGGVSNNDRETTKENEWQLLLQATWQTR